jgi:hypothetical protein
MSNGSNKSVFYAPSPYKPLDMTYAEWGKKWYEWMHSIKRDENPAIDTNGRNCALKQSGPVWFLAGTVGGSATRICTIPAGKDIFFPIINEMSTATQYKKSGQDLIKHSSSIIDQVIRKEVKVDDEKLEGSGLDPYRVQTGLFNVTLPDDNVCGVAAGPTEAVCDGYWVMIRHEALGPGKHTLHSIGEQTDGFRTEVTYSLSI